MPSCCFRETQDFIHPEVSVPHDYENLKENKTLTAQWLMKWKNFFDTAKKFRRRNR
jgi:hypothetical protein